MYYCLSVCNAVCVYECQSPKVHLTGKLVNQCWHSFQFQCQCRNGQQCHPRLPGRAGGTPGRAQVSSQGVRRRPLCPCTRWDGSYSCLCSNGLSQLLEVDGSGRHQSKHKGTQRWIGLSGCVRCHENKVSTINSVIFSSLFSLSLFSPPGYFSPRRGYRRVPKFCMGF